MRIWWVFFAVQTFIGLLFRSMAVVGHITRGRFFFRISVKGLEHLTRIRKPIIIIANHKTVIDHFFILAVIIFRNIRLLPIRSIGADWLFKVKLFKIFPLRPILTHLIGAYPARKGQGLERFAADPLRALAKGYAVGIYPEGGMRPDPGVHEVKVGTAYLAQKSGIWIFPVAIRGVENFLLQEIFAGKRKVTIVFGEPFAIDRGDDLENLKAESKKIRRVLSELYESK